MAKAVSSFMSSKWPVLLFAIFPISMLLTQAIQWLRLGVDMPLWDDWNDIRTGTLGSFNLQYLFRPGNDTIYPVGRFLDALAFHYLEANVIAYQLITMIASLGLLLLFQWRLLTRALNDRLSASACFLVCVFMMQPSSYWGEQYMSYYQVISLVCLLAILDLATLQSDKRKTIAGAALVLALISGLAYISGAIAMLVAAPVLLLCASRIAPESRRNLSMVGWATLIAGIITSFAQMWVVVIIQKGTHRIDAPMAYPYQIDFWMYLMGKVARSLMLPSATPALSLFVSLVSLAVALAAASWAIAPLLKRHKHMAPRSEVAIILSVLGAVTSVYLVMVAASRANLRTPEYSTPLQVFAFGYYRFHFFWATVIWPWVAASALLYLQSRHPSARLRMQYFGVFGCIVVLSHGIYNGAYAHAQPFRWLMERRLQGQECLLRSLQTDQRFSCIEVDVRPLGKAIFNAIDMKISFAKHLHYFRIPIGTTNPPPEFGLSKSNDSAITTVNTTFVRQPNGGVRIAAANDPIMIISVGPEADLANCVSLSVSAILRTEKSDVAQVFYLSAGETSFTEQKSQVAQFVSAGKGEEISFLIHNKAGFAAELRFDPVTLEQSSIIDDFEIRCRRRK